MEKLLTIYKNIPSKLKVGLLISAITVALVWFVLPLIKIDGTQPFNSIGARILVLAVIAIVWNIKLIASFVQQHKSKALPVIVQTLKSWRQRSKRAGAAAWDWTKFHTAETKAKIVRDHQRRRLRKLPWYAVVGGAQSGKRTMIKNTGLVFVRPEHFGEDAIHYINQAPDIEWWFSEQAVLLNTMTGETKRNQNGWRQLLHLLRRERKNRPLNGIILNFSIKDLVLYTNQERHNFIQETCDYLRAIHDQFKSLIPIYIVFSQCDLIEGFLEFFNDLSKDELRQIWGFTFPLSRCTDQQTVHALFDEYYKDLVQQLRKRVMWALDTERTERGRELITAFPQQMQLLKKPINDFVGEIFGVIRYHNALQMRGIYFTSCTQGTGEGIDLLMQAMSKKFRLVPPKFTRAQSLGECYFMQNLFHSVMYPESSQLGFSVRKKKLRQFLYKTTLIGLPLLALGSVYGMHRGYQENLHYLPEVNAYITNYNSAASRIKNGDQSLIGVLPAIEALDSAKELYQNSHDWGLHFLFMSEFISNDINQAMMRSLHCIFLPRIAAQLEQQLNQNIQDLNVLYATFKAYLAFSTNSSVSGDAIQSPMRLQWSKQFVNAPATENKLRHFLTTALTQPVEKLPLDNSLIDNIRSELEKIIPSQRAYGLLELRATVSNIAPVYLGNVAGSNFHKVFTADDKDLTIAAFYTRTGFSKVFATHYQPISQQVANDNQDIGLSSSDDTSQTAEQIEQSVEKEYNQQYTRYWMNALSHIHFAKFTTLTEAINTLDLISGKDSPIAKLLGVVYDNTQPISQDSIQVSANFNAINEYSHSDATATWSDTVKILNHVRNYLFKLERAANPNEAAFNAAKLAIQGNEKSPIQQLTIEAQNAPEPIKSWLMNIADNTWQIIVQSAHQYMNDAWQQSVMSAYNSGINGRYPIVSNVSSQITMANFNSFFGNHGVLEQYFNHYLKPFINTSSKQWKLYNVDGHTIEISQQVVNTFRQAAQIRKDFFSSGSKNASFSFSIQPITLDTSVSSIQLIIGTQHINYSFGPRNITQVKWPMPSNEQQTTISVTDFNNNQYSQSASDPWSMFKIFDFGTLKRTANNGTYQLLINLHNHLATYQITGTNDQALFTLQNLKGFQLPQTISIVTQPQKGQAHE